MLRSFRAQDFIQLPPLGEAGTLTLVDELEAAAGAEPKLPSPLPEGAPVPHARLQGRVEQSQQRLEHITEAHLDDALGDLGGKPFLVTVARAHRAYGQALSSSRSRSAPAAPIRTSRSTTTRPSSASIRELSFSR